MLLTFEQWLVERGKRTALSGAPYPPGYATSGPAQNPPLDMTPASATAPFALASVYADVHPELRSPEAKKDAKKHKGEIGTSPRKPKETKLPPR